MKIQMNMSKCTIEKMMFMDGVESVEPEVKRCVLAISETLTCNTITDSQETGIIIQEKFIIEAVKWNIVDLGNNKIMIKEISTGRFWSFVKPAEGNPIQLLPASNDENIVQILTKIPLENGFQVSDGGDLYAAYSSLPPKEGVILFAEPNEEARATLIGVNADKPDTGTC